MLPSLVSLHAKPIKTTTSFPSRFRLQIQSIVSMMEQFLLANVKHYQTLVGRFKPPRSKEPEKTDLQTSPNLVVATRIRPILEDEIQSGQVSAVFPRPTENEAVDIHEMRKVVRGPPTLNSFCFRSDRTFGPEQTTSTIYDEIVKPLIPWVWEGRVGTLFAYGQTGSGKTFTVSGLERLIASSLFEEDRAYQRRITVCFVELAGNSAYDLLSDRESCQILEDAFGATQLVGAVEEHVSSSEHLLQLIERAASFRQTAPTAKNAGSSRSHAICRIRVEDQSSNPKPEGVLYMIDLAGSEGARDVADHTAHRMKETREVNVSLSTLKDCIRAMALMDIPSSTGKKEKRPYIPFRQSALTKVLKHLFDPGSNQNCKTVILACISPSFLDVGASKNTLRYAEMLRVALPKSKPLESDPKVPTSWKNKDLKTYINLQSGYPTISTYDLAPTESGLQLLRLPIDEFVNRCLNTPGVTEEQARAFHSKLWGLHVKSQRGAPTTTDSAPKNNLLAEEFSSSRETNPKKASLHFKDRIRPGMAIRWSPPDDFPMRSPNQNLALVLSPAGDVGKEYLCALVLPERLAQAYEVNLWRQVVVDVGAMDAEVLLEYDSATRYYYLTV
ncbi:P-loop containing nucleoside triphosphate hydrolase protein [Aspergillus varians]